jgi:glutamate/tyrosine decarboxylase-like PLP-dependent enzyme
MSNSLLLDAATRAANFLESIQHRDVFPTPEAINALAQLDEPVPESGSSPAAVIETLDTLGSPAAVGSAGPRYFGFVTGGALPVTVAANQLATAWDQNAALRVMSPIAAKLEDVSERWLCDLLGFPDGTAASFCTGATMANTTALAAARHALYQRMNYDVEADGLYDAPPLRIVVGDEVHVSVLRGISLLGFGRERIERVRADDQGRIVASDLPRLDEHTIVCLQAGNVNSGALDPAADIVRAAHDAGAWVHVDGAFGLWALTLPEYADQCAGYQQADSWATDGHKWLNVPYDCGIAFVAKREALRGALAISAAYLGEEGPREPSTLGPEFSRRARAIEVWAALKHLGRAGLQDLFRRNCAAARRIAGSLQQAGIDVLNDVVLNQVVVRFGDDARTQATMAAIQADGTCWAGPTIWQGQAAMRISVSSWATNDVDVERSIEAIIRVAAAG